MKEGQPFLHPCKGTCSGYEQGRELGRREGIRAVAKMFSDCGANHPGKSECDETAYLILDHFAAELGKEGSDGS